MNINRLAKRMTAMVLAVSMTIPSSITSVAALETSEEKEVTKDTIVISRVLDFDSEYAYDYSFTLGGAKSVESLEESFFPKTLDVETVKEEEDEEIGEETLWEDIPEETSTETMIEETDAADEDGVDEDVKEPTMVNNSDEEEETDVEDLYEDDTVIRNDDGTVTLSVSWECEGEYNRKQAGEYVFTPVFDYSDVVLEDDSVELPSITVQIGMAVVESVEETTLGKKTYSLTDGMTVEDIEEEISGATITVNTEKETYAVSISKWDTDYEEGKTGDFTFTPVLNEDNFDITTNDIKMPVFKVSVREVIDSVNTAFSKQSYTVADAPSEEEIEKKASENSTLSVILDGSNETSDIEITGWSVTVDGKKSKFDGATEGKYVFTPVIDKTRYSLNDGVELPSFTVEIRKKDSAAKILTSFEDQFHAKSEGITEEEIIAEAFGQKPGVSTEDADKQEDSTEKPSLKDRTLDIFNGIFGRNSGDEEADIQTENKTESKTTNGEKKYYLEASVNETNETVDIEITGWKITKDEKEVAKFDGTDVGSYVFTPIVEDSKYNLDGIKMPDFTVVISETDRTKLVTECDGVTIEVTAPLGVIPADTVLEATALEGDDYDTYAEATLEATGRPDEYEINHIFDIQLLDEEGEEVTLNTKKGNVTVTFKDPEKTKEEAEAAEIFHFVENEIDNIDALETEVSKTAVSVETKSFSIFSDANPKTDWIDEDVKLEDDGFAPTSPKEYEQHSTYLGNPDGISEILYSTKYIEKNEEKKNEQYTYTTTIEHAVSANGNKRGTLPQRQDIVVLIDTSTTMGSKVDQFNNGISVFYSTIQKANAERIRKWNNGEYFVDKNSKNEDVDSDGCSTLEQFKSNHLVTMKAIFKYNNMVSQVGSSVTLITEADAETATSYSKINNKMDGEDGSPANGNLYDMTRTDLAMKKAKDTIGGNASTTSIVLFTDGEPYGYDLNEKEADMTYKASTHADASLNYRNDTYSSLMINSKAANDLLTTARSLKDAGVSIYAVYCQSGYPADLMDDALASRDVNDLHTTTENGKVTRWYADRSMGAAILALTSSDYPKNGEMATDGNILTGSFSSGSGTLGNYFKMLVDEKDLEEKIKETAQNIVFNTEGGTGYASSSSYVYDVVSHPFNVDTTKEIKVYKVPRIKNSDGTFGWGDEIDITNSVLVSIDNKKFLTVKGFDYEANAVSKIDKSKDGSGDYGYKLVVKFDIYANDTFGGNEIETNDSTVSGFYPASNKDLSPWEDYKKDKNGNDVNPDRNKFIDLYPIPYVDLITNYQIVSDSVVIFAPSTATLQNIASDANGNIFYADSTYNARKKLYEEAKDAVDDKLEEYMEAAQAYTGASDSEKEEKETAYKKAMEDYYDAIEAYQTALSNFEAAVSGTPDGDNNAYVDIHYSMKDPDGVEVGTMDISHGEVYDSSLFEMEDGGIGWKWTDASANGEIVKQGEYTITATVTPVTTTREESHTGSKSKTETTKTDGIATDWYGNDGYAQFSATGSARIYVYHMTGIDGALSKGDALGINEGSAVSTSDIAETSWMQNNLVPNGWKDLTGKTPEENGDTEKVPSGDVTKYGTAPSVTLSLPDKSKVEGSNRSYTVAAENGDYIPVAVKMMRNVGKMDKSLDVAQQIAQTNTAMNDNDNLYVDASGKPISSVVWDHVCDLTLEENCTTDDFTPSQSNNTMSGTAQVNVRYLFHIKASDNVPPAHKSTSNDVVALNEEIKWQISVDNKDESNTEATNQTGSIVDILPFNGDSNGSIFEGNLYYSTASITTDSAQMVSSLIGGTKKVYFTTDTSIRDYMKKDGGKDKAGIRTFANWTEAEVTASALSGTVNVVVPSNAVAMKVDISIEYGTSLTVYLGANIDDASKQKVSDVYSNKAFTYNGTQIVETTTVPVKTATSKISGRVFEDTNADGIWNSDANGGAGEPLISGVEVGLYKAHNPKATGEAITVDGVKYDLAINAGGANVPTVRTGDDGYYEFENLPAGTYYIVAKNISGEYEITKKLVGDEYKQVNSDAEEKMPSVTPGSGSTKDSSTAIIKNEDGKTDGIILAAAETKENLDIGLKKITGSIIVTKKLDEIYFPSTMNADEKADYFVHFKYTVKNNETGNTWHKSVSFSEASLKAALEAEKNGDDSLWPTAEFTELPVNKDGTYTLTEELNTNYHLDEIIAGKGVTGNKETRTAEFTITSEQNEFEVTFKNTRTGEPPAGDENQVINKVPSHVPIKLTFVRNTVDDEAKYPSKLVSDTEFSYTFSTEEVAAIVTYDDGSEAAVNLDDNGENFTVNPLTVTSIQNTKNGNTLTVYGYYTEKGRTLIDSFEVEVDLKPLHTIRIIYHGNTSTFNNGATETNTVNYVYDEFNNKFYNFSGEYVEPDPKGEGYTFIGWSTSPNGAAGVHYSDVDTGDYNEESGDTTHSIKWLAKQYDVSEINLYARWETYYILNGNGGNITDVASSDYTKISSNGDGLTAVKVVAYVNDYLPESPGTAVDLSDSEKYRAQFIGWMLDSNDINAGKWLSNTMELDGVVSKAERKITGPRTIYAIWFKRYHGYLGYGDAVQIPKTGYYKISVTGGNGGRTVSKREGWNDNGDTYGVNSSHWGGSGATIEGTFYFEAGTTIYFYVSGWAAGMSAGYGGYTFNGGGGLNGEVNCGAYGGGATDVRLIDAGSNWSNKKSLNSRIIVAGGGGGGGINSSGGSGRVNGSTDYKFGYGEFASGDMGGAGGGGWYGGSTSNNGGGRGGTSFIHGADGYTETSDYAEIAKPYTVVKGTAKGSGSGSANISGGVDKRGAYGHGTITYVGQTAENGKRAANDPKYDPEVDATGN